MNKKNSKKYDLIIRYIIEGYTTEKIAEKTGYSADTIRNIYSELLEKYKVNTKMEIALSYLKERLLKIESNFDDITSNFLGIK